MIKKNKDLPTVTKEEAMEIFEKMAKEGKGQGVIATDEQIEAVKNASESIMENATSHLVLAVLGSGDNSSIAASFKFGSLEFVNAFISLCFQESALGDMIEMVADAIKDEDNLRRFNEVKENENGN